MQQFQSDLNRSEAVEGEIATYGYVAAQASFAKMFLLVASEMTLEKSRGGGSRCL